MALKKLNRGALAGADRGSDNFRRPTNGPELSLSPFDLQLKFVRRFGVSPGVANVVAQLAFGEVAR